MMILQIHAALSHGPGPGACTTRTPPELIHVLRLLPLCMRGPLKNPKGIAVCVCVHACKHSHIHASESFSHLRVSKFALYISPNEHVNSSLCTDAYILQYIKCITVYKCIWYTDENIHMCILHTYISVVLFCTSERRLQADIRRTRVCLEYVGLICSCMDACVRMHMRMGVYTHRTGGCMRVSSRWWTRRCGYPGFGPPSVIPCRAFTDAPRGVSA